MALPTYSSLFHGFLSRTHFSVEFPEDAVFSAPVCVSRPDGNYDGVFVYRKSPEMKDMTVERPFAWVLFAADGRPQQLASWCNVFDFVPTSHFPLHMAVTANLPRRIAVKRQNALQEELLQLYEELRTFVFTESLTPERARIVALYKQTFLDTCYDGLYPFYFALSPDFFHWLRLAPPRQQELFPTGDYSYQVLEGIKKLSEQFQRKIATDDQRGRLFDEMHEEIQRYRNGLLDDLTRPIERDVILIVDNIQKSLATFESTNASPAEYARMLELFRGTEQDLEDLLYRQGVDPYTVEGVAIEVPRQKILNTITTTDPKLDKKLAVRLSNGWMKGERIVRPEYISAYLYEGAEPIPAEEPTPAVEPVYERIEPVPTEKSVPAAATVPEEKPAPVKDPVQEEIDSAPTPTIWTRSLVEPEESLDEAEARTQESRKPEMPAETQTTPGIVTQMPTEAKAFSPVIKTTAETIEKGDVIHE